VLRQSTLRESLKRREYEHGQQNACGATGQRNERALRQQLSDQAPAPGAERHPHSEFLAPGKRSREQSAGKVCASDDEDQSSAGHEHEKRRTRVADHGVAQSDRHHTEAAVVRRVRARQVGRDGGELAFGCVP
jgi:hypothetical protein